MELNAGSLSPEALFKMAQGLPDDRLASILAGRDNAVPQFVAQAVLSERQRIRQAQAGQQAQAQMAQQPRSKKEELLAGVASVAPDNIAQMAGGGIVAFSGESGRQDVRADRSVYDRYNWEDLPKVEQPRASTLPQFLSNLFSRDDKRIDPITGKPVSFGDFLRAKETSGVENARIALGQDFTTGLPLRTPTPTAPTAPTAPTRSVGGGGGGGGRAAAPAAAAPAAPAAQDTINAASYFNKPAGERPSLGAFSVTNPYAEAKSPEEYIAQTSDLYKRFGVSETPYAEREAELRAAQAGEAEKRRMAGLSGLASFGLSLAGAPKGRVGEAIGIAGQRAMQKYETDIEKLNALEEKRKEALQAIRVANNDIKRNRVDEGLRKRDAAEAKRADAELKISEIRARHQQTGAEIAAKTWSAEYDALSRQGAATLGADVEMRKMAQQAQLSREEIAAKLQAARIAAAASAARGERTSIEMEVYKSERAAGKSPADAFAVVMGIKKPEDPLKAGIATALGGPGGVPPRPPNAVQPSR